MPTKHNATHPLFAGIQNLIKGKAVTLTEDDIRKNPGTYSILSKLISSGNVDTFNNEGELNDTTPDLEYMLGLSSLKAQDIDDNESIMQLLPDLVRASQILISYILSPKQMLETKLMYSPPTGLFPQSVGASMMDVVKDYISKRYQLEERLYEMLYEILFTKGSYPIAVIPEASLDEIINGTPDISKESFSISLSRESIESLSEQVSTSKRRTFGFIGTTKTNNKPKLSVETYNHNGQLEVGHGDTHSSSNIPNEVSETNITMKENITFILPSDLTTHKKESLDTVDSKINLDTESGKWDINVIDKDTLIDFTDDYTSFLTAYVKKEKLNEKVNGVLGIPTLSKEGYTGVVGTDREIMERLFRNMDSLDRNNKRTANLLKVKTQEQTFRESVGEPIIINIPSEAVIPVIKAGSPKDAVGYIVCTDEENQILSKAKPINYYRELSNAFRARTSDSMASSLIQQGRTMFEGFDTGWNEARQIEMLTKIHSNAVMKEVLDRLRNGLYGKSLDLGDSNELSVILFNRALKGLRTRLIFLPKEIMSYMALEYDQRGIGVSLLDNMKTLLSLRIQFLLAQIRAGIVNSIPETVVGLTIDEHDPDPKKTVQMAKALALRSRTNSSVQIGTSDVRLIEEQIAQSNIRLAITSEHPKIPTITQDVQRNTADIPVPDQDTADMLASYSITGVGLVPNMVDNSMDVDFAQEVIQNNLIVNLTSFQKASRFNPHLNHFVKMVAKCSPKIRRELKEIVEANLEEIVEVINEASADNIEYDKMNEKTKEVITDYLVKQFIDKMSVNLPSPNTENHQAMEDELSNFTQKVDNAIQYMISSETLPDNLFGENGGSDLIGTYANIVKAHLIRDWMVENNYFPEIMDFITVNDEGTQTYEKNKQVRDYMIKAVKSIMEFHNEIKPISESTASYIEVNEIEASSSGSSFSSSDSGSDTESSGDDEFSMDNDFGDFEDDTSNEDNSEEDNQDTDDNEGFSPDEDKDGKAD